MESEIPNVERGVVEENCTAEVIVRLKRIGGRWISSEHPTVSSSEDVRISEAVEGNEHVLLEFGPHQPDMGASETVVQLAQEAEVFVNSAFEDTRKQQGTFVELHTRIITAGRPTWLTAVCGADGTLRVVLNYVGSASGRIYDAPELPLRFIEDHDGQFWVLELMHAEGKVQFKREVFTKAPASIVAGLLEDMIGTRSKESILSIVGGLVASTQESRND